MPAMQKKTCVRCGKEFYKRAGSKYCSKNCYHSVYYYGDLSPKIKQCDFCGGSFSTSSKKQKCCSPKCAKRLYDREHKKELRIKKHNSYRLKHPLSAYEKECNVCGKSFATKSKRQLYCSSYCRTKSYRSTPKGKLIRLLDFHKRNSEKKCVEARLTKEQWEKTKAYFKNCCVYCGEKSRKLQQDHFVPLKLKGNYTYNNIVPACQSCNLSKNAKHPHEWLVSKFQNGEIVYKKIAQYLSGTE